MAMRVTVSACMSNTSSLPALSPDLFELLATLTQAELLELLALLELFALLTTPDLLAVGDEQLASAPVVIMTSAPIVPAKVLRMMKCRSLLMMPLSCDKVLHCHTYRV